MLNPQRLSAWSAAGHRKLGKAAAIDGDDNLGTATQARLRRFDSLLLGVRPSDTATAFWRRETALALTSSHLEGQVAFTSPMLATP